MDIALLIVLLIAVFCGLLIVLTNRFADWRKRNSLIARAKQRAEERRLGRNSGMQNDFSEGWSVEEVDHDEFKK